MIRKMTTLLSTTEEGTMDNQSRRRGLAFSGLTSGVKARQRAGAFTLIELLVVIAIIAILAAMLLPVLSRAKATAQKSYCINNFKQLQLCYVMYVDDNHNSLPINQLNSGVVSWIAYITGASAQNDYNTKNIRAATLYPYNQNPKIYVCPANTYMLQLGLITPPNPPFRDDFGKLISASTVPQTRTCSIEYSMGSPTDITSGMYSWHAYQKFSQLQMTRVAAKIVFVDESSGTIDDGAFGLFPVNTANNWFNLPTSRHDKGGVFSFADGHVEYHHWQGTAVTSSVWQNSGPGNGGPTGLQPTTIAADSSGDLPWVQAGGPDPKYP
jgi:prepilin-type N-terminal cleavage/methylation domain-containing protein/prepilin-type processing-associated H-X9-DG protein